MASPAIDNLINQIIRWQGNKQKLLPLGRALDRVLTWNYYMLPLVYVRQPTAYWNKFLPVHPAPDGCAGSTPGGTT
ncbi:hypothetical protein ACLK1Y_12180 [Escherichia coli]